MSYDELGRAIQESVQKAVESLENQVSELARQQAADTARLQNELAAVRARQAAPPPVIYYRPSATYRRGCRY